MDGWADGQTDGGTDGGMAGVSAGVRAWATAASVVMMETPGGVSWEALLSQ